MSKVLKDGLIFTRKRGGAVQWACQVEGAVYAESWRCETTLQLKPSAGRGIPK